MNKCIVPKYIKDNLNNVFHKSNETKGDITCDCGSDVFEYRSLCIARSDNHIAELMKPIEEKADEMFEHRIGPFADYTEKNKIAFLPYWTYGGNLDKKYWIYVVGDLDEDYSDIEDVMKDKHYIGHFIMPTDNDLPKYEYAVAKCKKCGKEIVLFDSRYNGYDGICSHFEEPNKQYAMDGKIKTEKEHCKGVGYKIHMSFSSIGKKELLCDNAGDGTDPITEENWMDAFDWIKITLECAECGKKKKVLDLETM